MTTPINEMTDEQMQGILDECSSALQGMTGRLFGRDDLQEVYRDLMIANPMLGKFTDLATQQPALMQEALQAAVSMLTSATTFEAVIAERRRRATRRNRRKPNLSASSQGDWTRSRRSYGGDERPCLKQFPVVRTQFASE